MSQTPIETEEDKAICGLMAIANRVQSGDPASLSPEYARESALAAIVIIQNLRGAGVYAKDTSELRLEHFKRLLGRAREKERNADPDPGSWMAAWIKCVDTYDFEKAEAAVAACAVHMLKVIERTRKK